MKKWEVFVADTEEDAKVRIEQLMKDGYSKEDLSVLAKQKKVSREVAEDTDTEIERPVNEEAFGAISGILQSLSGGLVIPQVYRPEGGSLYAAGPFAKWFSRTDDKSVTRLLEDFDLTEQQIEDFVQGLEAGKILILAR
ncbi:general stress protein [Listeria kieliensis]|uniref:Sulfate transporter n=1 Tax=Listeria kieliensis TaxID=1621700 RepID=A0A3D8TV90_9LIST|nr:general stress protein [Listeria kieliensis]RDX02805.1 sulfate transporter [Listeria kieliensis]